MAQSTVLSADDPIYVSQYNNLRDDVLSVSVGHNHSGTADEGKRIDSVDALNCGSGVSGAVAGQVLFSSSVKRSTDNAYAVMGIQNPLRMEYVLYQHSDSNKDPGTWTDVSQTVYFANAFSTAVLAVVATPQLVEYVSSVDRMATSGPATDGVTLKFRWESSSGGVTNYVNIHVIAIGY
jgi:hypothetical protein